MNRALARFCCETVPNAIVRVHVVVGFALPIKLLADLADANVDGAITVPIRNAPDPTLQFVTRQCTSLLASQSDDESKLGWCQLTIDPIGRCLPWGNTNERSSQVGINAETIHLNRFAAWFGGRDESRPAQQRFDSRDQLAHSERLGEVVVGADFEGMHLVVLGAARGNNNHRHAEMVLANCFGNRPAVKARQHQVDHGDIWASVTQATKSTFAVFGEVDIKAGMPQVHCHRFSEDGVVFDYENTRHWLQATVLLHPDGLQHGRGMVTKWFWLRTDIGAR